MRNTKKFNFIFVMLSLTLIIILSVLEIGSFIIIKRANFYLPLDLDKVNTDEVKERFVKYFSFDLGWESRHPNKFGYIGPSKDINNAFLSLFGDSFTGGNEEIEKSWAYLLEKKIGRPVLNFGEGGYGTDQAYLRFEKRYIGKIKTPYVCLGIMSENIARVINRYRGFYLRRTLIEYTKPMFYRGKNGDTVLLPNPLKTPDDITLLSDVDFLKKIGEKDFWYNYYEKHGLNKKVHFPYSYFLINALPYYVERYYNTRIKNRSDYYMLYNNTYALSLMEHIILKFVNRAKENNTFPIILFLPNWKDLTDYQNHEETVYHDFYLQIKSENDAIFDAINYFVPYLKKGENAASFFTSYEDGHYNPYGERIVAEGFYKDLITLDKENNFLQLNSYGK